MTERDALSYGQAFDLLPSLLNGHKKFVVLVAFIVLSVPGALGFAGGVAWNAAKLDSRVETIEQQVPQLARRDSVESRLGRMEDDIRYIREQVDKLRDERREKLY